MSDSCNPMDCSLPVSSVHGILQATPLHWSGLPFPSPGDLPVPEIEPGSPALQADYLLIELVFPIQASNPALPCCRRILYQLGHQGSPVWCIQSAKIKKTKNLPPMIHQVPATCYPVPLCQPCHLSVPQFPPQTEGWRGHLIQYNRSIRQMQRMSTAR